MLSARLTEGSPLKIARVRASRMLYALTHLPSECDIGLHGVRKTIPSARAQHRMAV